ncbi:MAG: TraB/GumN family protein [Gammaproteobacteria bacterium]|nr:TraB/GumN family protein [Gammaproteobacteria bacterium]
MSIVRHVVRMFSALALTALLALSSTAATAGPLPLWEIESADNRVLIMGSVHFLRPSDYPLRDGLNEAYDIADTITMEINMAEIDQLAMQSTITSLAIDPDGSSLRELMGQSAFAEAEQQAAELKIPLAMFETFEPWFAALSVSQLRMVQLGFDPAWGVEAMLTRKAVKENKTLAGLETIAEQLGFMDGLDIPTQRKFLLQSLEDAASVANEVDTIVEAWKQGDAGALEQSLLESLEDAPQLYDALLVRRNKNWVAPISALREKPGDHLVVVGAMHLVGDDSVLAMLKDAGIKSRQLSDADF